jgi:tRNA-dihydrouridine synthase B
MQIEHRARQRPALAEGDAERLAVRELRRHLLWYTRGRRGGVSFRRDAVRVATAAEVAALIDLHFPPGQPFEVDPGFHPADDAAETP